MEFWEYCFNKRLEHYFFYIRAFLSLSMLSVNIGEDSLLWQVSSQKVNLTNRLILCQQLLIQGDVSASAEIIVLEAHLFALFS